MKKLKFQTKNQLLLVILGTLLTSFIGKNIVSAQTFSPKILIATWSFTSFVKSADEQETTQYISFTNIGESPINDFNIIEIIPKSNIFKINSAKTNINTNEFNMVTEYSSDFDFLKPQKATWTYIPISGGGNAKPGYDKIVKAIRWRVTTGKLSNISPNNSGNLSFVTKTE